MRRRGATQAGPVAWRLWPWIAALVPAAAGTLAALSLDRAYAALPVVHVRIDIASLALIAGLLASGAALAGLGLWRAAARRREQAVSVARRAAADDRRRFLRPLDHELKNPLTTIQEGLALVRAIVERHGGQAALRSRAGQGTVVRLRLPVRRWSACTSTDTSCYQPVTTCQTAATSRAYTQGTWRGAALWRSGQLIRAGQRLWPAVAGRGGGRNGATLGARLGDAARIRP